MIHEKLISLCTAKGRTGKEYFSEFDCFGIPPQFKLKTGDKYKTAFGAIISFFWLIAICIAVGYYAYIFFDKQFPMLVSQRYQSDTYINHDLVESNMFFWFKATDTSTNQILSPEKFFANFALHGTLSTLVYDIDTANKEKTDYIDAINEVFVPCTLTNWVRLFNEKINQGIINTVTSPRF